MFFWQGPTNENVVLNISDEAVIPPATEPIDPDQATTQRTKFNNACSGGFIGAQWQTVERWSGSHGYHLLEGVAKWSNISRKDAEANHYYQDFIFGVEPDPAFRYLLSEGANQRGNVEVEWERIPFPEEYWPTRGDRVSVLGYWVRDCGHETNDRNNTEIHPPVMVASHRARPVKLDGYGSDVIVPGIITDLRVNEDAGEITGNCSQTGLYQPFDPDNPNDLNRCLPFTVTGSYENPINRNMNFRIYLPKNPLKIYEEAGLPIPPQVPIFFKIYNPNSSGGPDPQITPNLTEGYLDVRVDLSSFSGDKYSRKIESAWVLPSPSNWKLKAWKVQIKMLDVHNDADGLTAGDGDWRFWANLNNSNKEWTKMYDCDGCVHGRIDYENNPWSTGSGGHRSLGPDVWVFPNQYIWLHTSGFDDDDGWSDNTGHVDDLKLQRSGVYSTLSHCTVSGWFSACGEYTLTYEISPGAPAPAPVLNEIGQGIFDSYKLTGREVANASFPEMKVKFWNHPLTDWDLPDTAIISMDSELFFPVQEIESFSIADMSNEEFANRILELKNRQPDLFNVFIKELREEFDENLKKGDKGDVYSALEAFKIAMPTDIWDQHFDYIKFPPDTWIPGFSNTWVVIFGILFILLIAYFIQRKK